MNDPRYPYTYAADLIRMCIPYGKSGCKLSRSDASQIRQLFTKLLNMDDKKVAEVLADYFINHGEELSEKRLLDLKRIIKHQDETDSYYE